MESRFQVYELTHEELNDGLFNDSVHNNSYICE